MFLKYYFLFAFFRVAYTSIVLDIAANNENLSINYSGINVNVVTDEDVKLFKIGKPELKEALRIHYGRKPNGVYLKSPTPWGDLYNTYKWEQVTRVISVHSARVKDIKKNPVTVMTKTFTNKSNKTVKVDTSISHTVENTLTTSWTKENEFTVSQEIEYGLNFMFEKLSGTTGFSYTSKWGKSEEKAETVTIGSTSSIETQLEPGQAITAVLSANAGYIEVDVVYKIFLRGNLAVNFGKAYKGHHFYGPVIGDVMNSGGITNEIFQLETIKFGYHVDASLTVYDLATGQPL